MIDVTFASADLEEIAKSEQTITLKMGIFIRTFTKQEVYDMFLDLEFLEEAYLSLVNPDYARKTDLNYYPEDYAKKAEEYFMRNKHGFAMDFLEKIFKKEEK